MSDRVAIIGGNVSGRDHFPYPNVALDLNPAFPTGDHTAHPLAIDLETMCRWFYLVRKWQLSVDYGWNKYVNGVPDEDNPGSSSMSVILWRWLYELDFATPIEPTQESDLVYFHGAWAWNLHSEDSPSSGQDYSSLVFSKPGDQIVTIQLSTQLGYPEWSADMFHPLFSFVMGLGPEGESAGQISTLFSGTPFTDLNMDGESVALDDNSSITGVGTEYGFTSAIVEFVPQEFWAYATKAGLPVYNTSTGAIINDPLS